MSQTPPQPAPEPQHAQRAVPPAPETQIVTRWKIACDGGEGALGHPRVWLVIPHDTGFVECGYCDKRFEIDRGHAHDDH